MKKNVTAAQQPKKKKRRTRGGEIWHRMKKNKGAMVGLAVIVCLVLTAILTTLFVDYNEKIVKMDLTQFMQPPSWEHPFGTDTIGRDMMSRVFYGARYSLAIAFSAQTVGIVFGILFGALAGYFEGLVSDLIMRFCDIFQAIPATLMAIVVSQTLGASFFSTTIALAVTTVPSVCRVVRALVMQIRNQEYIEAGKAINCSNSRIILRHILPNLIPQVIISFTSGLSFKMLESASLSYLGLGIQPPLPEWGALLADGKSYLRKYPHLVVGPGVFIMIAALAFNLVGDGLRDALDPKLRD